MAGGRWRKAGTGRRKDRGTLVPILVTNPAEPGTFYAPSNRGVHRPDFTTTERRLPGQITVRELLSQTSGLADAGFPAYTLYPA